MDALFAAIFSENPVLDLGQLVLFSILAFVVFLVLYTLRDVILRTRSLWAQIGSLILVTVLPILGFLVYLLVRPSRTLKERELETMMMALQPK